MDLIKAIKERRSVKKFSKDKPDWRKIIRAIDATRFAPSAGNNFVMKFILVSEKGAIKEIAKATQQDFVGTAHYVVVAVSDDSKLVRLYKDRGVRYSSQQAGAAIENFLLTLTEFGLETTWVGYFYEDQIREALGIPSTQTVEAVFPIGILAKNVKVKKMKKLDLENVVYFDKWGNKFMDPKTKVSLDGV